MARRWGRTAVDVLLSDCQYRKGTALCGQCGVWNTAVGNECKPNPVISRFVRSEKMPFDDFSERLVVGCLTSQQHASVSQGRICSENFTCCHTETEVADQTFHLTQSQYTDTGPTSPSADPITPGRVATGVPMFKSLV